MNRHRPALSIRGTIETRLAGKENIMETKTYLGNAFSLQMVGSEADLLVRPATVEEITSADFISCIGHADTANVLAGILDRPVEANRLSIKLNEGDVLYVAQVMGGRLPEGATTLPEGMKIEFRRVELA